jgi:hypothetical protein
MKPDIGAAMGRWLALPAVAALLCACTTETLYLSAQQWQRQECQKLQDRDERSRCEKSTARSYEQYKAEAEAARKPRQP